MPQLQIQQANGNTPPPPAPSAAHSPPVVANASRRSQGTFAAGTEASLPPVVITQNRPKAVLAASADIEKYYAEQEAARAAAEAAASNPPPAPAPNPPAAEPSPPVQQNLPGIDPPPAADLPPPVPPQDQNWEHQYRSERGRTAAALRRAEAAELALADLTARLTLLENNQRNPLAPPPGPLPDLTAEEIEALGPDLVNMVNKRAAIIARAETARLEAEVQALKQGMTAATQQRAASTKEMFYADMDTALADWRVINNDTKFLAWLDQEDVLSGQPKRVLLLDAFEKNNAQRVIAFFKQFLHNGGVPNQGAGTPQAQGANQPPKLPLEALAAPGRGASSSAKVEDPKSVWTPQEITRFYDDVRRGRFAGREAEQRAYEADLMLAQAEGRIRQ